MKGSPKRLPDTRGHYGPYGGKFVPETLMPALAELEKAYRVARQDPSFRKDLDHYLVTYAGRPTPLHLARRMVDELGGKARIYLKREDLCHTGAHKINNTLGQVLLALRMGKRRVTAETGAGQHGVATATAAALFGLECTIFMGEEDIERQALNVFRMKLLGATVVPVSTGTKTLKDAMSEAIRDWVTRVEHTYYVVGSVGGPHPYPMIVRDFQSVIGKEVRRQLASAEGRLPDLLVACVGGGSNAMGLFHPFAGDRDVRKIGVEAGGFGLETGRHGASITSGKPGVLHGSLSYLLQTEDGQVRPAHSVSAGLDYPGVGPELSYWRDQGLAEFATATDGEAIEAFRWLAEREGIIPALESAHAVAHLKKIAPELPAGTLVVLNLSGRGDKDVQQMAARPPSDESEGGR